MKLSSHGGRGHVCVGYMVGATIFEIVACIRAKKVSLRLAKYYTA